MPKLGVRRALMVFGALQALSNSGYLLLALAGKSMTLLAVALAADWFCNGLGAAAFAAYQLSLCDRRFSATQFAIIASASTVLGRLFIAASVGSSRIRFGLRSSCSTIVGGRARRADGGVRPPYRTRRRHPRPHPPPSPKPSPGRSPRPLDRPGRAVAGGVVALAGQRNGGDRLIVRPLALPGNGGRVRGGIAAHGSALIVVPAVAVAAAALHAATELGGARGTDPGLQAHLVWVHWRRRVWSRRVASRGQQLGPGKEADADRLLGTGTLVAALDGAVAARLRDVAGAGVVLVVAVELRLALVADLLAASPQGSSSRER